MKKIFILLSFAFSLSSFATDLYSVYEPVLKPLRSSKASFVGKFVSNFVKFPKGPNSNQFSVINVCGAVPKNNYAQFGGYKSIWSETVYSDPAVLNYFKETTQYYIEKQTSSSDEYLVFAQDGRKGTRINENARNVRLFFKSKEQCENTTKQIFFSYKKSKLPLAYYDGRYGERVIINSEKSWKQGYGYFFVHLPSQNVVKQSELKKTAEITPSENDDEIMIIEYGDFECPFTQRSQKIMSELRAKYGKRLNFEFRNLPLSFHKNAQISAQYYESVKKLYPEKADMFKDHLFKNQKKIKDGESYLIKLVKKLKLDHSKIKKIAKSDEVLNLIENHKKEASKLGFQGTPAFLVNGKKINGAQEKSVFEKTIESK